MAMSMQGTQAERTNAGSRVSRLEARKTTIMEPVLSGDSVVYRQADVDGYLWRCEDCGLVWDKKWYADSCSKRSHVPSFEQGPYGVTHMENGVPQGRLYYYTRRAIRRDRVVR